MSIEKIIYRVGQNGLLHLTVHTFKMPEPKAQLLANIKPFCIERVR